MRSAGPLERVLSEYRDALTLELGEGLHSVILYGSQARGEAGAGSDIDILCVMKSAFDYVSLIERTSRVTAELSLKYDVVLSRAFVRLDDFESGETPFLMNVRREGVHV